MIFTSEIFNIGFIEGSGINIRINNLAYAFSNQIPDSSEVFENVGKFGQSSFECSWTDIIRHWKIIECLLRSFGNVRMCSYNFVCFRNSSIMFVKFREYSEIFVGMNKLTNLAFSSSFLRYRELPVVFRNVRTSSYDFVDIREYSEILIGTNKLKI